VGVPVRRLDDGWTVATADGSPAVHVEHTVAVTAGGARILTPLTVHSPR
jgi:methionyl aminopeptidase